MDHEDIIHNICLFLSVPEMVWLGCCSKQLEEMCRASMGRKMQSWKDSLKEAKMLEIEATVAQMRIDVLEQFCQGEDRDVEFNVELKMDYLEVCENLEQSIRREEGEHEEGECGESLLYKITSLAISQFGEGLDATYFAIAEAFQGGPIYVSALHFAAMTGDLPLCRLLLTRGASVNSNIFIPNDQNSNDKSEQSANHDDGFDYSQYRWGLITPLRMAITFGTTEDVESVLLEHDATAGRACITSLPEDKFSAKMAGRRPSHLPYLPADSCWTNREQTELMYRNTYMNGVRIYYEILFTRGVSTTQQNSNY